MVVLEWVISDGGPILAIPSELARHWRGTSPPDGAVVAPGWTWGDGGIVCDYDRACDDMDDAVMVGDSATTWSVAIAGGRALVMAGETSTAAIAWEGGCVLLRHTDVTTMDEARQLVASIQPGAWVGSSHVLDLRDGCIFVFDAAYPGATTAAEIAADGGVLDIALAPGQYRVDYAGAVDPADRLTLIRLSARGS